MIYEHYPRHMKLETAAPPTNFSSKYYLTASCAAMTHVYTHIYHERHETHCDVLVLAVVLSYDTSMNSNSCKIVVLLIVAV